MRRERLRVIVDRSLPAALNMAIDDVLLAGEGAQYAWTLRLYGWARPTVSLGYSQAWRDGYDPRIARRLGVDLVRRRTGGRAVLHDRELTYSMAGPGDRGPLAGGIHATYRTIAAGLQRGLERLGVQVQVERGKARGGERAAAPGACFAVRSRYEILADGRKLLGSAQRRAGGRVMQHGSLPLQPPDPDRWAVLGASGPAAARDSTGLWQAAGERVGRRALVAALAVGVAAELGLDPVFRCLSRAEWRRSRGREREYRDEGFTRRV